MQATAPMRGGGGLRRAAMRALRAALLNNALLLRRRAIIIKKLVSQVRIVGKRACPVLLARSPRAARAYARAATAVKNPADGYVSTSCRCPNL